MPIMFAGFLIFTSRLLRNPGQCWVISSPCRGAKHSRKLIPFPTQMLVVSILSGSVTSHLCLYASTKLPHQGVLWSSSDMVNWGNDSRLKAYLSGAVMNFRASDVRFKSLIFTSISGKWHFILTVMKNRVMFSLEVFLIFQA